MSAPFRFGSNAFLDIDEPIEILDVGAAAITEEPVYSLLLAEGVGHLNAFEGDDRQQAEIRSHFGPAATVFDDFLYDGTEQTVHLATASTGMTSLLAPDARALRFFNGFETFGTVHETKRVRTRRLDDVGGLPSIDFAKMDVQGSELVVLKNGTSKLAECVAVQLEISFVPLYVNQPTFGEVDVWMRSQGFVPHRFVHLKQWSIRPTIFSGNFRVPGNQLLEADIVYVRDPLAVERLTVTQLKKLAILSHYAFASVDLCVHWLLELERRHVLAPDSYQRYYEALARSDSHPLHLAGA